MRKPLGWISEPLKVMGGNYPLPKQWETNTDEKIGDKLEDLLDIVSSYDGVGQWDVARSKDGIAIVLIHDKGGRIYIAAPKFFRGEGAK